MNLGKPTNSDVMHPTKRVIFEQLIKPKLINIKRAQIMEY